MNNFMKVLIPFSWEIFKKKKKMCTVHQLRHERVPMWLDLNLTHGMAVSNGKGSVGCKVLSLARAKGVTALGRK